MVSDENTEEEAACTGQEGAALVLCLHPLLPQGLGCCSAAVGQGSGPGACVEAVY